MNTKHVSQILIAPAPHMVGDGFRVQSVLPGGTRSQNNLISPFILMDYGAPAYFPPTNKPRGVDQHPHKGFETVTVVYQGELEHRDSTGSYGKLAPGDVQWMTAGAGIVHEEKHETAFSKRGGKVEMAQLWVNLPKAYKNTTPGYQNLTKAEIPVVQVTAESYVRVIAGAFNDIKGAATTFSPVHVLDVHLKKGDQITVAYPENYNTAAVVLNGEADFNGNTAKGVETVLFEKKGTDITITAVEDATILVLSGEPIDEPIFAYGPFVMNSAEEIEAAIHDYNAGKMGFLS
ncbi:pirin family protein [Chitinophaga nivalis]|uniref:Pirin family protein n=1 Tax=Chitinophaga nivalis TaxID=2991709 RepID=A0ABT3IU67_9BACT|nr:pirin family protein [Chitinophaga nivalis]MCW3462792.1 pirin family protein [Chitinophaga nivalis]MCW3487518.1 pirin family protein [Chitinophaga nivalis]